VRVLALDLGSKRIGVAVSDPSETIASPDRVLERTGSRARDHKAIGDLVAEWEAELVVVGLPLSLSGDDGPAARATREEVAELALALTVPVELHDERLTTVTASRTLQEAKMTADARRRVVDKVAAAVLLQSWLDERASRRRREGTETGMTSDG
jgi:putative Holliday junction resolvase